MVKMAVVVLNIKMSSNWFLTVYMNWFVWTAVVEEVLRAFTSVLIHTM